MDIKLNFLIAKVIKQAYAQVYKKSLVETTPKVMLSDTNQPLIDSEVAVENPSGVMPSGACGIAPNFFLKTSIKMIY